MVGLRCEGFHIQYCVVGKKILQPSHLQDRDDFLTRKTRRLLDSP